MGEHSKSTSMDKLFPTHCCNKVQTQDGGWRRALLVDDPWASMFFQHRDDALNAPDGESQMLTADLMKKNMELRWTKVNVVASGEWFDILEAGTGVKDIKGRALLRYRGSVEFKGCKMFPDTRPDNLQDIHALFHDHQVPQETFDKWFMAKWDAHNGKNPVGWQLAASFRSLTHHICLFLCTK